MSLTSAELEYNISESETYGIEMEKSNLIKVPYPKIAKISMECKYIKTSKISIDNKECSSRVIFGHVVGININDEIIVDQMIDITKVNPLARLGYNQYSNISDFFTLSKK